MTDLILKHLPVGYGRVTSNFEGKTVAPNIGIVIPTFSRLGYLKQTFESLQNSLLPNDCILIIVDETMASKCPGYKQYEYFENIDFKGGDIKQVNQNIGEIFKEAEQINSCVSFNEAGWLKHSLSNPRKVQNSRFGTYIKKSFLINNPTFHRQILEYIQNYNNLIDTETVEAIELFNLDIPIIKIFKNNHKNMFDSLKVAFDLLVDLYHVRHLVNIDSDTIHSPNWLTTLTNTYSDLSSELVKGPFILSGFNADKKKNLRVHNYYVEKKDLGGINLFFDAQTYTRYVRETLVNVGWDLQLSKVIRSHNGSLIALRKSVIQHIGKEGMWSEPKTFDYSSTFQCDGAFSRTRRMKALNIFKRVFGSARC